MRWNARPWLRGARECRVGTIICPFEFIIEVPLVGLMSSFQPCSLGRTHDSEQNLLHVCCEKQLAMP